jgi:hypothetical protein
MTLSLATRGYLCLVQGTYKCGPGPVISGIESVEPGIRGSSVSLDEGPTLVGAGVTGPEISGSAGEQQEPAGDTPVISGGGVLTPEGNK